MKNFLLLSLAALALTACHGANDLPDESLTLNSSNPAIPVELLFVKDSCRMYRFEDPRSGRTIYWSNCQGRVSEQHTPRKRSTQYNESITTR